MLVILVQSIDARATFVIIFKWLTNFNFHSNTPIDWKLDWTVECYLIQVKAGQPRKGIRNEFVVRAFGSFSRHFSLCRHPISPHFSHFPRVDFLNNTKLFFFLDCFAWFNFYLCSSLFVLILMGHSVYFETMRLQRAPLSERLLTQRTFIRADTCNEPLQWINISIIDIRVKSIN